MSAKTRSFPLQPPRKTLHRTACQEPTLRHHLLDNTGQAGAVPSARNESQPHLNLAVHTSGTAQTLWHEEPDLDSSFEQDDRDQPTLDTESVQRSTEPANDDLLANTLRNLAVAMTLTLLAR